MKMQMLKLVLFSATMLVTGFPALAEYRWVEILEGDCAGNDRGAPACNLTEAKPRTGFCNQFTVNTLAVCWDQTPPFPLPGGCNIPACTYKDVTLQGCMGASPASNGIVFECVDQ